MNGAAVTISGHVCGCFRVWEGWFPVMLIWWFLAYCGHPWHGDANSEKMLARHNCVNTWHSVGTHSLGWDCETWACTTEYIYYKARAFISNANCHVRPCEGQKQPLCVSSDRARERTTEKLRDIEGAGHRRGKWTNSNCDTIGKVRNDV